MNISFRVLTLLIFVFVGGLSHASDFHASCRSVGSTIVNIDGKDTSNATMTAITTMSDIEQSCEVGYITQGTLEASECEKFFVAEKALYNKVKVIANCNTGQVWVDEFMVQLPIEQSCANGGTIAIDAHNILCPNSTIQLGSSKEIYEEKIKDWNIAHSTCLVTAEAKTEISEKACTERIRIGKELNLRNYCFFSSGYSWFNCNTPPPYVDLDSIINPNNVGRLSQSIQGRNSKVKWKIRKPFVNEYGMRVCETTSSRNMGVRFFDDGTFILAMLDVPTALLNTAGNPIVVEETQIEANINFGGGFTYGTYLRVFDKRVDEFGHNNFIIGLVGSHSHVLDELIRGEKMFVKLGSNSSLPPAYIREHADLVYSLTGSSKALKLAQRHCWN